MDKTESHTHTHTHTHTHHDKGVNLKTIVFVNIHAPNIRAPQILTHLKGNRIHPVPSLHGKYMGKQCQTLFLGAPKSLQMVIAAMKLKDTYSLEEKL